MRIRTVRRAKAIKGTNAHIVKSSTVGGMRQVRCFSCHCMMVPGLHHDGQSVLKCTGCGVMATSRPM